MTKKVRVSVVFPQDLWEEFTKRIPRGERSRVIAEATRREVRVLHRSESVQRLGALQGALRRKYGEMPPSTRDIHEWREKRDADISGLR